MTKTLISTLLIFCLAGSAGAQEAETKNPKVALMVYLINSATGDVDIEGFLSQELPTVVLDEWEQNPDPSIIRLTASLLEHPAGWIVSAAAVTLGHIGPDAEAATPALLKALEVAPDSLPTDTILAPTAFEGDTICGALARIGTTPEDAPCISGHYKYY